MRKIIIIGTLHAGITPKNELKKYLDYAKPDQVLVEIAEADLRRDRLDSYPTEMVYALNWARKRNILVNGFDCSLNTLRKGMTADDNQRVIREQKKLMKDLTWKDLNKSRNLKKLNTASAKKLVDPEKEKRREIGMFRNIQKTMIEKGTILILTGCGHLNFFEKHIKEANFPLR